jgi:3-phosphoshikimate 1-carboxyvinyltransferase
MQALGTGVTRDGSTVTIEGRGLDGLRAPAAQLDAGNSGSTIRMLSGILAGQPFTSTVGGDESLSRRPMGRIITPLTRMGASIKARDGGLPPLEIHGAALKPIDYELPVASAQVKTAVLFAGLYADGVSSVKQPLPTRDHSEHALREFGAHVESDGLTVRVHGRPQLHGRNLRVPSDLSSAAFFLAAALLLPESELVIEGVGLNPTRAELLDVLLQMGADIEVIRCQEVAGEAVGDLRVRSQANAGAALKGGVIEGAATAGVIDEVPILAVLGALSREGLEVRDAAELRIKETDRIATLADNLARLGVRAEVFADGIKIPGRQTFQAAELDSFGDHRIAMAFAVAALRANGPCGMAGAEAASVSFPEFYSLLDQVAVR